MQWKVLFSDALDPISLIKPLLSFPSRLHFSSSLVFVSISTCFSPSHLSLSLSAPSGGSGNFMTLFLFVYLKFRVNDLIRRQGLYVYRQCINLVLHHHQKVDPCPFSTHPSFPLSLSFPQRLFNILVLFVFFPLILGFDSCNPGIKFHLPFSVLLPHKCTHNQVSFLLSLIWSLSLTSISLLDPLNSSSSGTSNLLYFLSSILGWL